MAAQSKLLLRSAGSTSVHPGQPAGEERRAVLKKLTQNTKRQQAECPDVSRRACSLPWQNFSETRRANQKPDPPERQAGTPMSHHQFDSGEVLSFSNNTDEIL